MKPDADKRSSKHGALICVRLSDNETAAIDAQRRGGEGRSTCLRRLAAHEIATIQSAADQDRVIAALEDERRRRGLPPIERMTVEEYGGLRRAVLRHGSPPSEIEARDDSRGVAIVTERDVNPLKEYADQRSPRYDED